MSKKVIKHYGTKRHSGRYPWGSGGHSQQSGRDFLGMIDKLKKDGLTEKQIADSFGMKTTELRQIKSIEKNRLRAAQASQAMKLKAKGMSNVAIGERMGLNESSVRALLDPSIKQRAAITQSTSSMLKDTIAKKGPVDVGVGVEANLGISRTKLLTAVKALEGEGYGKMYVKTKQLGTDKYTSIMVLTPPGMTYSELYANRGNIATITDHSIDGGRSFQGLKPVQNVKSDRIQIRYSEDGGNQKDGVIEMRRGVSDLDLGNSKYAQVRIGVDGDKYMKGMAVYTDDIPPGVDMIYNTTKKRGTPPEQVFKPMKVDATTGQVDADNPFGATIKRQQGALNILDEEGEWSGWSRNISSQVLSKQSPALAKKQLGLAKDLKKEELDEILSLENPVVKRQLLETFADDCDSSAVHLKAASLPRQASHVLLPIPSMKDNEVYAPMFNNGENVVLIRHPHGGVFEIPELIVNNRNPEAKSIMQNAKDAVGINAKVAQKLSGADFDGDTVIVIPNKNRDIKTSPSLAQLKDFDPREAYPAYEGMKPMTPRAKQLQMGDVSNLITDMTIKGATPAEIARAVKHSMVVIDAEKHNLNYRQSAIDNGIRELKEKYQGGPTSGASTIVSKASSQRRIDSRAEGVTITDPKTGKTKKIYVDPKTGEKLYTDLPDDVYVNKQGKVVRRQIISTKMAEAKDAFELSSGTQMETVYAEYANSLKAMAKQARLEALRQPNLVYNKDANKVYKPEVDSLLAKLREADKNKPLERQAQLAANEIYAQKLKANPNLDASEKKRLRGQVLTEARARLGAKKPEILITDREWTAIQLGAVSNNTLERLIRNTNLDHLKEKSMPRTKYKMTDAKVSRAKTMAAAGYTPAEIASALGVSATTIRDTLND